jgi:23S rRNA (cytidine1920-2'-O)/16S rRNA (cytidine1409-2'-O)-methyltransferase
MADKGGFVGRGGIKLSHGLEVFGIDPAGMVCADLGCSTGGFADCLLKRGAVRVHAVDTGYGVLDYSLRRDERVVVHERVNALHLEPAEKVDLVVIDLGWTVQARAIPAGLKWLKEGGRIVTLIKPMYEIGEEERAGHLRDGVLDDAFGEVVARRVYEGLGAAGAEGRGLVESPIRGGGSRGRGGNREWLALVVPSEAE